MRQAYKLPDGMVHAEGCVSTAVTGSRALMIGGFGAAAACTRREYHLFALFELPTPLASRFTSTALAMRVIDATSAAGRGINVYGLGTRDDGGITAADFDNANDNNGNNDNSSGGSATLLHTDFVPTAGNGGDGSNRNGVGGGDGGGVITQDAAHRASLAAYMRSLYDDDGNANGAFALFRLSLHEPLEECKRHCDERCEITRFRIESASVCGRAACCLSWYHIPNVALRMSLCIRYENQYSYCYTCKKP